MRRIRYWLRKLRQRRNHALQERFERMMFWRFRRAESFWYQCIYDAMKTERGFVRDLGDYRGGLPDVDIRIKP